MIGKSREHRWVEQREAMVKQLRRYGIKDKAILRVMGELPRHEFIPEGCRNEGNPYGDHPCSIGFGQTISQPYIVAYMTEKLGLTPGDKVLEIGTGSAYQAAILGRLGMDVFTIERIRELAAHARTVLARPGCDTVRVFEGNGYGGLPDHAPFDGIVVTCAPDTVPEALKEQLGEGGRMIIPVGTGPQQLVLFTRTGGRFRHEKDIMVRFVPMVNAG